MAWSPASTGDTTWTSGSSPTGEIVWFVTGWFDGLGWFGSWGDYSPTSAPTDTWTEV